MKRLKILIPIKLILILSSCDCWTDINGTVYDSETQTPLDSVQIKSFENGLLKNEMMTDSTGKYYGSTGNTGFCKDLEVQFSKEGYITKHEFVPKSKGSDSVTIYLERIHTN